MAQIKVKVSIEGLRAFAAVKNYSHAQQLVIDALYAVVRAGKVGSLALRLRAEQRLRAAEDDFRRAAEALDKISLESEPELCPDAQDFETEEGYEIALREWEELEARRRGEECAKPPEDWKCTREVTHEGPCAAVPRGSLGRTESLADEMMP